MIQKADQLRHEINCHVSLASLDYKIKKFLANFEIEPWCRILRIQDFFINISIIQWLIKFPQ